MKVSFRNNSFNNFNINNQKNNSKSITTNSQSSIPEKIDETNNALFSVGTCNITPTQAGKGLAALLAIAGVAKFRKNISKFFKDLVKPSVEETVKEVKPRVKKLYNDIHVDLWEKLQKEAHERYIRTDYGFYPSGTLFVGPDCKAKEKAVEEMAKFLENNGWKIKNLPVFDPNKTTDKAKFLEYCHEYRRELYKAYNEGDVLYKTTGQKTALVLKGLDTLVDKNRECWDALLCCENFKKYGLTWISDCKSVSGILAEEGQFIRTQRMDKKLWFRPLQEDSKEVWETYLSQWDNVCQQDIAWCLEKPTRTPNDYTRWYMQDAIDKFPEQYRESSELYQKLKDTKYYPFEY